MQAATAATQEMMTTAINHGCNPVCWLLELLDVEFSFAFTPCTVVSFGFVLGPSS